MREQRRRGVTPRAGTVLVRVAVIAAALLVLLAPFAESGYAGSPVAGLPGESYAAGPGEGPAGATSDLGAVRADGVAVFDALASFGGANAYTFRVTDGPGTAEVYVGDLWYDVDVLLWRASSLPSASHWRTMTCDAGAGCLATAPASPSRRVQFVQPKGIFAAVEPGSYAVVVRPRDEAAFSAARKFTVWVAVAPPTCAVGSDSEGRYQIAVAMTPARPRRADLVTLTAYVLPPFGDLFEFEWSVGSRRLAGTAPTTQVLGFDLGQGRSGSQEVQVIARGVRSYPDPAQPEIPPTLAASCALSVN